MSEIQQRIAFHKKMPYQSDNDFQSQCMYSRDFSKNEQSWTFGYQISSADANYSEADTKQPLREKNRKNSLYKHVPHKEKPPQVIARRNARERRRVQAVNLAFVRLRKTIPIQNARGKRISKVKTLQNAIRYIRELEDKLRYGDFSA